MMAPPRKFDWEEARRLREEGLAKMEIARCLGVTPRAVGCALNGTTHGKRRCPGCGTEIDASADLCNPCRGKSLVNRDDQGKVYCARCDTWKTAGSFRPGGEHSARGVVARCRLCESADRKARRHANQEAARAYDRERRRQKRIAAERA